MQMPGRASGWIAGKRWLWRNRTGQQRGRRGGGGTRGAAEPVLARQTLGSRWIGPRRVRVNWRGQWIDAEGSQNERLLVMDRGTQHKMFPREVAITTSSGRVLLGRLSLAEAGHPFRAPWALAEPRNKLPSKTEKQSNGSFLFADDFEAILAIWVIQYEGPSEINFLLETKSNYRTLKSS
jgi:hypothetical protein